MNKNDNKTSINTKFHFTSLDIPLPQLRDVSILAASPRSNTNGDWLLFTSDSKLLLLKNHQNTATTLLQLDQNQIDCRGHIQLVCSDNGQYIAISSLVDESNNIGWIIDLNTKQPILKLDSGDYRTGHTDFPVAFLEENNNTLLIHATDWDRLDITDLSTLTCITQRNFDNKPENWEDNDEAFSEWYGKLLISPNKQWIASIGWVWHPLGVMLSWDLQAWLRSNIWEADFGMSKRQLCVWDYFWDSPFCWVNDTHLCIWGHSEADNGSDIPLDTAAVFDVTTGELVRSFPGPTMDIFYFDQYLFSGTPGEKTEERHSPGQHLTVWDITNGTLLHQEDNLTPIAYHPISKTFLSLKNEGTVTLTIWKINA